VRKYPDLRDLADARDRIESHLIEELSKSRLNKQELESEGEEDEDEDGMSSRTYSKQGDNSHK
jgi:hypothetical protein